MFDAVFAVALAIPIIGMLIALTVLLSSWRWVLGFVLIAGAALLLVRMSYGLFPNPALARTVLGLLVHSSILAALAYCGGLLWYLSRRAAIEAPSSKPNGIDRRQVRVD